MLSTNQMPAQVEEIGYSSVSNKESLRLTNRLKLTHTSLPETSRLMRCLHPIILILLRTVDRLRNQLPVGYTIAA